MKDARHGESQKIHLTLLGKPLSAVKQQRDGRRAFLHSTTSKYFDLCALTIFGHYIMQQHHPWKAVEWLEAWST